MRIAIVVHQLAGGGAEHVAALWTKGFIEKGDEVFILLYNKHKPIVYDVNVSIRYFDSSESNRFLRLKEIIKKQRTLFKELKPDVIITILHPIGLWSYVASRGLGIPVIHTEHDSFERPQEGPSKLSFKAKFYKFFINKLFTAVTVLTESDKKYIGRRLKKVFVMPNPLAYTTLKYLMPKKNIILAVGRVDVWHVKGFDNLIKAWDLIASKYKDWELHIVGNSTPESRDLLLGLCKDNQTVGSVRFVDFTKDLAPIYSEASIFVLSSRYEGFGMVLVEAMSQGCACIACDYKGRQSEIITKNSEGILSPCDDYLELSNNIEKLLTDKQLRNVLQLNALERSRAYSLSNIIDRWYSVFESLKIS